MKKRILEDFEDKVLISYVDGKEDVITFVTTAAKILHEFNEKRKHQQEKNSEKMQILRAAANIIRSDIKVLENNNISYPSVAQIA